MKKCIASLSHSTNEKIKKFKGPFKEIRKNFNSFLFTSNNEIQ